MRTDEFKPRTDPEKRMWTYMMKHPRFRYVDVMAEAKVSRHYMDIFAAKLRRHKLIKPVAREGADQYFTVMDDDAADAFAARKRGQKEGVMWTAMRSLKCFTVPELQLVISTAHPDLDELQIATYCADLKKADYLAVIQKRTKSQPPRFKMVNDTGPLPPVKRTLQVIVDSNEDRAVWAAGARI